MQNQLDNLAFASLGLSIPLISYLIDNDLVILGVIMLLSLLFFAIAFNQIRQERIIFHTAIYNDSIIRPQINTVLSKLSNSSISLLKFEEHLIKKGVSTLLLNWISVLLSGIISMAIGLVILMAQFYLQPLTNMPSWSPLELGLLAINLMAIIIDLGLALHIARQRQAYFQRYISPPSIAKSTRTNAR